MSAPAGGEQPVGVKWVKQRLRGGGWGISDSDTSAGLISDALKCSADDRETCPLKGRIGPSRVHFNVSLCNAPQNLVLVFTQAHEADTLAGLAAPQNLVDVEAYGPAMQFGYYKPRYSLADFASQLAGQPLVKDNCGRDFGKMGTRAMFARKGQKRDQARLQKALEGMSERLVNYAAADAWVTRIIYEHLQEGGMLKGGNDGG